jgi:hypothetical protein
VAEPVDLVLFDPGGVLIDVAGVRAMLELTGINSEEELWRRWLTCRWVRGCDGGESELAEGVGGRRTCDRKGRTRHRAGEGRR